MLGDLLGVADAYLGAAAGRDRARDESSPEPEVQIHHRSAPGSDGEFEVQRGESAEELLDCAGLVAVLDLCDREPVRPCVLGQVSLSQSSALTRSADGTPKRLG